VKRILIVLLVMGLGVAALVLGPDIRDMWYFQSALDAQKEVTAGEDPRVVELAMTCDQCHGASGNSQGDSYPSLAGQPERYLLAQLDAFADGRRDVPQMRGLAAYLSAEDRQKISRYYASRPVALDQTTAVAQATDPFSACKTCHGSQLQGATSPVMAPRLAGQGRHYLARQLVAYKSGERSDATGAMNAVAKALELQQIEELASQLAALRGPEPSR